MVTTNVNSGSRKNSSCTPPPQCTSGNLSPKLHPQSTPPLSTRNGHPLQMFKKEAELGDVEDSSVDDKLVRKWEEVMGSEYEVKVGSKYEVRVGSEVRMGSEVKVGSVCWVKVDSEVVFLRDN